ncbi:MAG: PqqD family protein [Solirubrobacteraceae bacterium]|nr:PqqD family protein [Solirubrobacteraceae bacterium]
MVGSQVVHETLDGETVVINLATGTYFSLEGTAAQLWEAIVADEPRHATAVRLAGQHHADVDAVLATIDAFHAVLAEAQLITASSERAPDTTGNLGTLALPKLQAYTDLSEHLLLDPIHDVERGEGWPAVPST